MASRYFTNCLSNLSCSNNFSCDASETESRPLVICLASPHTCCGARIKWYLIGVQKSSSLGWSYRTSPFTNKRSQLLRFRQRYERERVANLSHFISRTLGPRMQSWIMTAANRKEDGFFWSVDVYHLCVMTGIRDAFQEAAGDTEWAKLSDWG